MYTTKTLMLTFISITATQLNGGPPPRPPAQYESWQQARPSVDKDTYKKGREDRLSTVSLSEDKKRKEWWRKLCCCAPNPQRRESTEGLLEILNPLHNTYADEPPEILSHTELQAMKLEDLKAIAKQYYIGCNL